MRSRRTPHTTTTLPKKLHPWCTISTRHARHAHFTSRMSSSLNFYLRLPYGHKITQVGPLSPKRASGCKGSFKTVVKVLILDNIYSLNLVSLSFDVWNKHIWSVVPECLPYSTSKNIHKYSTIHDAHICLGSWVTWGLYMLFKTVHEFWFFPHATVHMMKGCWKRMTFMAEKESNHHLLYGMQQSHLQSERIHF